MNILQVSDLKTYFSTPRGVVKAVDGVSFDIEKGKVFGIVGESGSGKTMTALSILRLVSPPGKIVGGKVLFKGVDLLSMDEEVLRGIRGAGISFVFQEPATSLDPVFTVGEQIVEAILAHQNIYRNKAEEIAFEYLAKARVGDVKKVFHDYPHQLSGGTKQRVGIATALANSPELIILDEPTTALDVTIQAQILDLLQDIIRRENLSILFISHDVGIIARMCDRVAVMLAGRIVEAGETKQVLSAPRNAYTVRLLESARALS